MNIFQPDIERMGVDAFVDNILVNIQEDLNGGQQKSKISEYYISNYSVDVTFSDDMVNVRLYTESEGWKQSSLKINKNVITNSN
jgi:hypothetical protein